MCGTSSTSMQKGLNKCCKLLLLFSAAAAAAREAGKMELSAIFREGNEWVPHRCSSQGSEGGKAKGTQMGRIPSTDSLFGHQNLVHLSLPSKDVHLSPPCLKNTSDFSHL